MAGLYGPTPKGKGRRPTHRPELTEEQRQEARRRTLGPSDRCRSRKRSSCSTPTRTACVSLAERSDGQAIDYHELKVAMRALGFDLKKAEVLKILRDHDKGHGLMGFDDFSKISALRCCGPAELAVTERILARDPLDEVRRAFRLFDDDGSGKISLRNLRRVAKELGETLDDEELQAMIDEFDLDQDGEISEAEFVRRRACAKLSVQIAIMTDD